MTDNPTDAHTAGEPARTAGADRPDVPMVREIADLLARLRALSGRGAGADPAERAAFLADKHALIARIEDADPAAGRGEPGESAGQPGGLQMSEQQRADAVARLAEPLRPDDPAEIAARTAELRERIAARDAKAGPAVADAGPEVIGLVCPECGEDAVEGPLAALVPYEVHGMDRPDYRHPDGEPLCPVMGPRGYQPADPAEVTEPARQLQDHEPIPTTADVVERAHRATARVPEPRSGGPGEQERRDQLAGWHAADQTAAAAAAEAGSDDAQADRGPGADVVRGW